MLHQYKDFVGANTTCDLHWEGKTTLAPASSTVRMQIYNQNTTSWETVASNTTASINTDFTLDANMADLTNYKDASKVISSRIYQQAL